MKAALIIAPVLVAAAAGPLAAQPAAGDVDAELAALGIEPEAFDDKLNIYGFADFLWGIGRSNDDAVVPPSDAFMMGNVNVYLAKNLARRWRALIEVRFLFAPNGGFKPDGTIEVATTTDAANLDRPISWGGVSIERAYVEYDLHPLLTVRAGHWLTPYGIWNIDHGSPAIISSMRPYIIGEQFFPEHQTGLELFGSTYAGDYKLSYHATISNGRSPVEATRDLDSRAAFGGRLAVDAPLAGELRIGASAYTGRNTGVPAKLGEPAPANDEVAYGADLWWKHGGLLLQGELIVHQRRFVDGQREQLVLGGFTPDGSRAGAYALAGYRLSSLWNAMPFVQYEYYKPYANPYYGDFDAVIAGINFRPNPAVVLKLVGSSGWFEGGPFGGLRVSFGVGQVAFVF